MVLIKDKKLKIDFHTHILPENIPDFADKFGYGGFIKLQPSDADKEKVDMVKDGRFFRTVECNCFSPSKRIQECDQTGVDVQVLSTVPVMFSYWAKPKHALEVSVFLNDHIARVVNENPSKFIGLGTIPMQDVGLAIQELRRCVTELGLNGVQIGSHVNDYNLGDPIFEDLWKVAEELDTVIFVHPWDMDMGPRNSKYWFPWLIGMPTETTAAICSLIFSGVYDRYPNLKVVFAHGGGSFFGTLGRIIHGYNCRPDLVALDTQSHPLESLKKLYFDSLVHDQHALKLMVNQVGFDRIVLGSDYPFPLGEQLPGELIESSDWISEEDKVKILSSNALKLFNLSSDRFI
ncbi:2-amino-3-carboxymuconate-6-semialdehyde decarboxylase [Smittium mucronatum]|uniref:2-amino-3-carboxymuconate-6-semialdehyde decarboxylase n=1 Tax=Smittium mucronatum TaxID=133383 RepID=A0A1R0GNS5_9FUNG|nr:2-amino-3-carboxymuconate-6-semialdehyde decarboxylase [Smittium mucronatum]